MSGLHNNFHSLHFCIICGLEFAIRWTNLLKQMHDVCVWERVMSWASSVNLILWLLSEVLVYVRMLTVCRFTRGARHRFCFCRASADIFFEFRRENSTADATRSWRIPVGDLALFWHIPCHYFMKKWQGSRWKDSWEEWDVKQQLNI